MWSRDRIRGWKTMQFNQTIDSKIYDPSMGINPHENAINRLVNTRKWSVENSAKWITDEHEAGSYDYKLKNLDEDKEIKYIIVGYEFRGSQDELLFYRMVNHRYAISRILWRAPWILNVS